MAMLEVYKRLGIDCEVQHDAVIVLTHEQREKGRLKTETTAGVSVGIFLDRGKPLIVGEYLRTQCGKIILVEGAKEPVATASCLDWVTFSRACYHLGNRHIKIQLGDKWLRITPDYVLEAMLESLGLTVTAGNTVFIPEPGAYSHGASREGSHNSSGGKSHGHHHH